MSQILHGSEMRIRTVAKDTNMLLELLNLGLIDDNLLLLIFSSLHYGLHIFVENFVFISLALDVSLQDFVVLARLHMEVVLDDLSLLNQDIHHYIDLLSDLVGLLLEQLKQIVASHQLIF